MCILYITRGGSRVQHVYRTLLGEKVDEDEAALAEVLQVAAQHCAYHRIPLPAAES